MALDGDEVAAYEPASGYADPSVSATGFMRAAKAMGARLVQGAEVTSITTSDDGTRVTGVGTTAATSRRRSWSTRRALGGAASGRWSASTSPSPSGATTRVHRRARRRPAADPRRHRQRPVMYMRPEGGELLLIGLEDGSIIGGSPDRDTATAEPGFSDVVTDRIVRRLPALADGTFRAAHSGQDGLTPDQRSILGQAGPDGFYLDCGHSGTGFKTAPAIGLGMAELILDGVATSVDIAPFEPARFAEGRLLVGEHGGTPIWR